LCLATLARWMPNKREVMRSKKCINFRLSVSPGAAPHIVSAPGTPYPPDGPRRHRASLFDRIHGSIYNFSKIYDWS
jgi:hypothetical protein